VEFRNSTITLLDGLVIDLIGTQRQVSLMQRSFFFSLYSNPLERLPFIEFFIQVQIFIGTKWTLDQTALVQTAVVTQGAVFTV